jgi:hypothetical protein
MLWVANKLPFGVLGYRAHFAILQGTGVSVAAMKPRYERLIDHGVRRTTVCPFFWTLHPISSIQVGPGEIPCTDSIAWSDAK